MESDLSGRTLGDFQLESLLGKGSMARVYQAQQVSLRRFVALKVIEEGLFTPGENVTRFLREAESLAQLEHPNIVPIYAAGEQNPYYFFAMRLVRGGTLDEAMREGIKRATAIEWAGDICRGLAYAHASGIVHRDLKPTNVLIHDGVALLSDFGLARLLDASTAVTQMGHVLGTPLYMSPEQTLGENAGPPADCFALGIILYQMLTGHHPFIREERKGLNTAARRTRLFQRIQAAEFYPPSQLDPEMPPALEKLILRALARKPEDRFPDGPAMLQALEAAGVHSPQDERVIRAEKGTTDPGRPPPNVSAIHHFGSTVSMSEASPTEFSLKQTKHQPDAKPHMGSRTMSSLGRYKILRELGHGGQGVVYEAHDPVLDRTLALKVLRRDSTSDPRLGELFLHEARVAARLNHPHIITIYDFGIEDQCEYLTMQLIDGPSLDRLMEKQGRLPPIFALAIAIQAADALGVAHLANVIHLDVKPGNILIQRMLRNALLGSNRLSASLSGELGVPHVLLTDFTMSRVRHAMNLQQTNAARSSQTLGTISYCSPEQLTEDAESLTPASDLFSLGVVLHEMLSGQRLFAADDPAISRERVLSGPVPAPSTLAEGIPSELDAFCARLLCRNVNERIQTAGEAIAMAEPILKSLGG